MTTVISIIIRVILQGFLFWGVMKIFDRDNTRNTLPMAIIMGIAMSFGGIISLVGAILLLIYYYDMGIGEMILFLILLFAISLGIGYLINLVISSSN